MNPLYLILIILGILALAWFIFDSLYGIGYDDGKKQGHIDEKTGKDKIVLVEFKDGERKYRYESELKDLVEHTVIG